MKSLIVFLSLLSFQVYSQDFSTDAKNLAQRLKGSLQSNLKQAIQDKGVVGAVEFCHLEVGPIAKKAADQDLKKFSFGRTSHRVRNPKNAPQNWQLEYIEQFQKSGSKEPISGKLADGTSFYLEPLYIQAQCLMCHGEKLASPVQEKIQELYPKDKATGFKLNEFRGIIWITSK